MNKDINNIFSGYRQILNEQVATGDPMADVEAAMSQQMTGNVDTDLPILQQQIEAITGAQQSINPQIEQITADLERVRELAKTGSPVEQHMDPATGGYRHETAIQQLTNQYTQLQQLAQQLIPQAQQAGIDVSALMEASQQFMDVLTSNVEIVTESLSPLNKEVRAVLVEMIQTNTVPDINVAVELVSEGSRRLDPPGAHNDDDDDHLDDKGEDFSSKIHSFTDDDPSMVDILGMPPEDFEDDDPDDGADLRGVWDKTQDVELANRSRPAANDLMADLDALERLVDDETRGVMEDEESSSHGPMNRREAREIAKDIIKKMIDQL